jgi:predicted nucleic acid-binding protein
VVIHTDVFLDHLSGDRAPSILRRAMSRHFCYTTVFQAIELFSIARSERELRLVKDAMATVKLLGLNARTARKYGEMISEDRKRNRWNILIAGLCLESKLPLLTNRGKEFAGLRGLRIVPANSLLKE